MNENPYQGCFLQGKNIPALPWPNGTHGQHRQHPSGI